MNRFRRKITGIVVLILAVVAGGFISIAAKPNENDAQKAIESFLKRLAENRITRIEVYYMRFHLLTEMAITEDFLRDNFYDYKVIAKDPNLAEVAKALQEFKFEKSDLEISDFRWGCVFYAENEEILRLFFPRVPVVVVNGVGYKATPELIRSLMQFLPVKTYNEMNEFIENEGRPFWPDFSKQQAKPLEQQKSDKP